MHEDLRLGARLRAARKAAGFKTSKQFLKKHKVPASTFSQHESGARKPDDEILKFYSKVFNVNFDWLKTGEGKPFNKHNSTQKEVMAEELLDLNSFKKSVKKTPTAINEKLLIKILKETLAKKSNHSLDFIVKNAVGRYVEAASK